MATSITAINQQLFRFKSSELQGNIDGLMSSSCTELMTAWSNSNRNFKVRIYKDIGKRGIVVTLLIKLFFCGFAKSNVKVVLKPLPQTLEARTFKSEIHVWICYSRINRYCRVCTFMPRAVEKCFLTDF